MDSSSESESESYVPEQHRNGVSSGIYNGAYVDDASSTISDELFKSNSEGPEESHGKSVHGSSHIWGILSCIIQQLSCIYILKL